MGSPKFAITSYASLDFDLFNAAFTTLFFNSMGFSEILELPWASTSKPLSTAMAVVVPAGILSPITRQSVIAALKRSKSKDAYDVIANLGDPMIPLVAGMLGTASQTCKVLLAGGTQMAAVLALGHTTGFNENNIAIGTTSYIVNDDSANFLDMIKEIADIPILIVNPKLEDSKIQGLRSYSGGFVKEGAGAGGAMISAILKTGLTSEKLLEKTEKEYQRITTLQ